MLNRVTAEMYIRSGGRDFDTKVLIEDNRCQATYKEDEDSLGAMCGGRIDWKNNSDMGKCSVCDADYQITEDK